MNYISTYNNSKVGLKEIPELEYKEFVDTAIEMLAGKPECHCVSYFGHKSGRTVRLVCCIADDKSHHINIFSTVVDEKGAYNSLTARNHNFECFEREIHENFSVHYTDHPWLKPYRKTGDYPFLRSDSEELHEVGVGPIHAGIIEPGHFRFICNGEQIMHLEISLGYQSRGIERLFIQKQKLIERATLAENIAADTTVGHATAFANLWETLCNTGSDNSLDYARTLAMELERIAIHTGDLSAICGDIAYQLGGAVYGRLRTPIVNFFQEWGGNRIAKGLIRPGKINYPFTPDLSRRLYSLLEAYERDFNEISAKFVKLPSALSRLERTGVVTYDEVLEIGTVGMAARMSGLRRDIRESHPFNLYGSLIKHEPVLKRHGDVYSRVQVRREEIWQSLGYVRKIIADVPESVKHKDISWSPAPDTFVVSMTEGWRGEICHCAMTDKDGKLSLYKIKDPSHHNWMALALSVRNNEISDFPVCNKSFNLSYCGHDL